MRIVRNDYEGPDKPNKGEPGGACNRSRCQQEPAEWYNHGTRRYYCEACADWLNTDKFNRADAMRLFGHDLCTKEPRP